MHLTKQMPWNFCLPLIFSRAVRGDSVVWLVGFFFFRDKVAVLKFATKTRMAWNSQRSIHLHLQLQVLGLKFCTNPPCRNIPAVLLCHGVKSIQGRWSGFNKDEVSQLSKGTEQ